MATYPGQLSSTDRLLTLRNSVNSLITDVNSGGGVDDATTLDGLDSWSDSNNWGVIPVTSATGSTDVGTRIRMHSSDADFLSSNFAIALEGSSANPNLEFIDGSFNPMIRFLDADGSIEMSRDSGQITWGNFTNTIGVTSSNETNIVVAGNDYQFLNTGLVIPGNVTLTGTVDGRDVAADGTKLDSVASSADNYLGWEISDNTSSTSVGAADVVHIVGGTNITATHSTNANQHTITLDATGTADASTLNTKTTWSSNNNWDVIPVVDVAGVIDIGRYIDFHSAADADADDYDFRIDLDATNNGDLRFFNDAQTNVFSVLDAGGAAIPAGDRFYLDGANGLGDTYIREAASNNLEFVVGGLSRVGIDASGLGVADGGRIYFDGTSADGDTYIRQALPNVMEFGVGNIVTLELSSGLIDATGAITATGDITAFASDERLKNVIEDLDDEQSYKDIQTWKTFKYTFNDIGIIGGVSDEDIVHIGVSAQDIQATDPEFVKPAPFDTNRDGSSKSGEKYLTVQYEKLTTKLVSALKYQTKRSDSLEARLLEMEDRLQRTIDNIKDL